MMRESPLSPSAFAFLRKATRLPTAMSCLFPYPHDFALILVAKRRENENHCPNSIINLLISALLWEISFS